MPLTSLKRQMAQPGESYLALAPDAGWCWFADPRAVYYNETLYAGWVDSQGSLGVGALSLSTGEVRRHIVQNELERDDHDNPTFAFHPNGRLMLFYSRHSRDDMYVVDSVEAGDISRWHPARLIQLNDVAANAHVYSGGHDRYTYPSPFRLTDEERRIYLFWRGLDHKPNLSISNDDGKTWSAGRIVVIGNETYLNQRPYTKMSSNGRDRIHMAFTDGHPRNEPTNSIHYACLRAGSFYRADGSKIGALGDLPFKAEDADVVYDARPSQIRSWVWDVATDHEENPVIVYARFARDDDHRYHYARWDGQRWHDHEVVAAGPWFPQTPAGEEEREPHYSGGIVLDPVNPDVVYLSRLVDGVREIERWQTRDRGVTWERFSVTSGSKHDNIRPYVVNAKGGSCLLWLNVEQYRHYTDYRCSLRIAQF